MLNQYSLEEIADIHNLLVGVNELGEVCIAGEVGDHLCLPIPSS